MDAETARAEAARRGQGHLFTFWDRLDATQQAQLLADLAQLDLGLLDRLIPTHVRAAPAAEFLGTPEPADALPIQPGPELQRRYDQARILGRELIAEGKVAALVVAGGQGTRLGFDRPKGEYPISPVKSKPLFQLFAEAILATGRRYGRPVPWYVMTGPGTDAPTREFFEQHGYFGLRPDDVWFFCQGVMPALDRNGRILLDRPHRISLSPDGHGGCLRALATRGVLADMRRRGIEEISYFQVDNPLVSPVDPLFIGLHRATAAEMSAMAVPKVDDLERVGNFVRINGRLHVIEYSDLPDELAHVRNPDGSRKFDDGNVAVHAFSLSFLERLTQGEGSTALPWHRAEKNVPYVELATGRRIEPDQANAVKRSSSVRKADPTAQGIEPVETAAAGSDLPNASGPNRPNAVKLELFVFDALPLAERTLVLRRDRAECFSPVKNAEGPDSPATARRDLSRRAARWLETCGVPIPRTPTGYPDGLFEISPLFALDPDQLRETLTHPPSINPGARVYLG